MRTINTILLDGIIRTPSPLLFCGTTTRRARTIARAHTHIHAAAVLFQNLTGAAAPQPAAAAAAV